MNDLNKARLTWAIIWTWATLGVMACNIPLNVVVLGTFAVLSFPIKRRVK